MSFARPTLQDLIVRINADLNSRLENTPLRRSINDVLARVLAGAVHMLYGYLNFISRQVIIDTAESDYLDRWAAVWGLARRPASFSTGKLSFTLLPASSIHTGTVLNSSFGIEYETTEGATSSSTTLELSVIALTAGSTGNLAAGERLTLRAPIAGVESVAIVGVDGIAGGQDRETDDSLRGRILSVIQNPPQGGSIEDYVQLASSIPGVGRVFVTPGIQGIGTVGVSFLTSDPDHLIPAPQLVQQVQDFLDLKKPVTATVLVFAPTPVPLSVTVSNLSPDSPEIRQAVAEEIADLILREATPGGSILLSHIREAVSIATGENDHVLVSPVGNVSSSLTEILVPGVLTFV